MKPPPDQSNTHLPTSKTSTGNQKVTFFIVLLRSSFAGVRQLFLNSTAGVTHTHTHTSLAACFGGGGGNDADN